MTTAINNNSGSSNTESPKQQPRSKRIELVIVPGRSLGPFRLGKISGNSNKQVLISNCKGSSLWDTLHFLSRRPQFFPSVELKYSQEVKTCTK
jgi:hypothetical protein